MSHIPVLLNEVIESTKGVNVELIFDGTFGRGGHCQELLKAFPQSKVIAFDRDHEAIEYGQIKFIEEIKSGRLQLLHRDYREWNDVEFKDFDFMLLDLGVSSPQLDLPHRGFSFYNEGPLDMRMDTTQGKTAADLLNECSEKELVEIFQNWGEIKRPYRVVRATVHDRKEKPWESTRQWASMIERVDGWRVKGHHPATQYFMALRIAVNSELEGVQRGVRECMARLKDGGRLDIITFHSLEDRMVKQIFKGEISGFCVNKKVIQPTEEEVKMNPRARSAKLRIFQKGKPSGDFAKINKKFT